MTRNTSNHTNATKCHKITDFLEVDVSKGVDDLSTNARLILELLVLIVDIRYRHRYERDRDE